MHTACHPRSTNSFRGHSSRWPIRRRCDACLNVSSGRDSANSVTNGKKYRFTIIHAEDDYNIPWHHSELLFRHAVNASVSTGITYDGEQKKLDSKRDLGAAGSVMEWRTTNGIIQEEILNTGLHDVIMGYPIIKRR
jgi:hypothetical protein